ncbi:MAG: hypothetical protein QXK12_00605 [Candidatus Nezhaarchaeales archaeon]
MSETSKKLSTEERLTLTGFERHTEPHIKLRKEVCVKCVAKPCLYVCPAGLFTLNEKGEVQHVHEGCLECGACRIICPDAVEWSYPPGGFGVYYRHG